MQENEMHTNVDATYFMYYRLLRQVVDKKISIELATTQLGESLKPQSTTALFVDALNAIEEELKIDARDENGKTSTKLVQNDRLDPIKEANILPAELIRLSVDAAIPDAKERDALQRRRLQIKTRLYYKQVKFNLLREENEGYSKLIVDLSEHCDTEDTNEKALHTIRCLIGQFNLDPNRVIDVVLECFERRLDDAAFFAYVLRQMGVSGSDLCHLLGFKFEIYQGRKNDVVPWSLYNLSAEMIKQELIELESLMLHLAPTHSQIMEEHKKREAEAAELAKKAMKPMAALDKHEDTEPADTSLATNQKLGVLCALVERGAWTRAHAILGRIPEYYAFATSTTVVDVFTRLVDRKLDKFHTRLCPEFLLLQPVVAAAADSDDSTAPLSFDEASTMLGNVVKELSSICISIGPHMGRSPHTHIKLSRVLQKLLTYCNVGNAGVGNTVQQANVADELTTAETTANEDAEMGDDTRVQQPVGERQRIDDKMFGRCVDMVDECLLPSLTVMQGNAPACEALWSVLQLLPYTARFRLYYRWTSVHPRRHPILSTMRMKIRAATNYNLKRLAKETIKQTGRQLCKLIHVFPGVVFDLLLNQVQTFDNFIGPTVDSIKCLTPLDYDVLSFSIVEQLCKPEKQKLKASDAALSPWLISLSTFVAHAYKRYNMELTCVLQYIANELKDGNSYDLLILRDIVLMMSGVETSTGMTQELIQAASGGPTLVAEGGRYGESRNVRKAAGRLREALLDEHLAVALCILIAQQRDCLVYDNNYRHIHLKLLSQLLDQCQETFVQFGEFLRANVSTKTYNQHMPTAGELIDRYHLSTDAAMFLARPRYQQAIIRMYDRAKKSEQVKLEKEAREKTKQLKAKEEAIAAAAASGKDLRAMAAAAAKPVPTLVVPRPLSEKEKQRFYQVAFDKTIEDLAAELKTAWESAAKDDSITIDKYKLNPLFVATFWAMTSYDIQVPTEAYKREIERLTKQAAELDASTEKHARKAAARVKQLVIDLTREREQQVGHSARFEARLSTPDNAVTKISDIPSMTLAELILRQCVLPRCRLSELDATYCGQFVRLLHRINAPNFPTLNVIWTLFNNLSPVLTSLTEAEVNNIGVVACDMLAMVNQWHGDRALVERMIDMKHNGLRGYPTDITYAKLANTFFQIHFYLAKMLVNKLVQGSYVSNRNSLLFLMKILPQFPLISNHYNAIVNKTEYVIGQEKADGGRQDLMVLASSYLAHLKKRQIPVLIERKDFGDEAGGQTSAASTKPAVTAPSETTVSNVKRTMVVNGTVAATAAGTKSAPTTDIAKDDAAIEAKRRRLHISSDATDKPTTVDGALKPPPTSTNSVTHASVPRTVSTSKQPTSKVPTATAKQPTSSGVTRQSVADAASASSSSRRTITVGADEMATARSSSATKGANGSGDSSPRATTTKRTVITSDSGASENGGHRDEAKKSRSDDAARTPDSAKEHSSRSKPSSANASVKSSSGASSGGKKDRSDKDDSSRSRKLHTSSREASSTR